MQWTETQNPLVIFGQITRFFFPPPFLIDFLMQLKILQLSRSRGSNRFTQEVINGIIEEALLKAKQWLTASSHLGEPSHIPVSPTELAAGGKEGRKEGAAAALQAPQARGSKLGLVFRCSFDLSFVSDGIGAKEPLKVAPKCSMSPAEELLCGGDARAAGRVWKRFAELCVWRS